MKCNSFCLPLVALFALVCGTAQANLLVNPGFEDPSTSPGVEYAGAPGWTPFGAVFTVNSAVVTPHSGDQSLKMFGGVSGVFQEFAASEGQLWDGGAWILNDPAGQEALMGGQVAAVNIEWRNSAGDLISFVGNGDTISTTPTGEWILRPVSGVAPANTAFARFVLITGEFGGGGMMGGGGAPKFDDAFFAQRPIPEPSTIAIAGLGLCAVIGLRRRLR